MEDLRSAIQAGYFFDPAQPNNYGKDVAALTKDSDMDQKRVAQAIFSSIATVHGQFWNDKQLGEQKPYLRGSKWTEDTWNKGQGVAIGLFKAPKVQEFFKQEKWAGLGGLLEKAISLSDWAEYEKAAANRAFTLVHGDFHPGNMLVLPQDATGSLTDEQRCCFLDWEMVGIGSGAQELGQFLISHATSEWRREHEKELVTAYHAKLSKILEGKGAQSSFEDCWSEYVNGGLGKFMWFLPYLVFKCPPGMAAYFAKKVLDFANDHGITKENIQMLRFF
jgi:thiamine kinase-like enzyme